MILGKTVMYVVVFHLFNSLSCQSANCLLRLVFKLKIKKCFHGECGHNNETESCFTVAIVTNTF